MRACRSDVGRAGRGCRLNTTKTSIERRTFLAAVAAPIAASAAALRLPSPAPASPQAIAGPVAPPRLTCLDRPADHYFASQAVEDGETIVRAVHASEEYAQRVHRHMKGDLVRRKWRPAPMANRFMVADTYLAWVNEPTGPMHTLDIPNKFAPSSEWRAMEDEVLCDRETAMAEAAGVNSGLYDEMAELDEYDVDAYFANISGWSGVIELGETFPHLIHVSIDDCGMGEFGISTMTTARLVLPTAEEISRFARPLEWTT